MPDLKGKRIYLIGNYLTRDEVGIALSARGAEIIPVDNHDLSMQVDPFSSEGINAIWPDINGANNNPADAVVLLNPRLAAPNTAKAALDILETLQKRSIPALLFDEWAQHAHEVKVRQAGAKFLNDDKTPEEIANAVAAMLDPKNRVMSREN